MTQNMSQLWARARDCELAGDVAGAKGVYETILREDPGQAMAWLRLSEFERMAGHYRASRQNALRAASEALASRAWKTLPYISKQLLAFDERDAVHDLIVRADWTDDRVLGQSPVLSQSLWLADRYDDALRLIDSAEARFQPGHLLAYSRASALKYLGRMDEATDEFERCLSMSPHYAFAHWSLAFHAKANPLGSRIDRIRAAQAAHAKDAPEQAYLGYALFKELDDAGQPEQAAVALQAAMGVMRKRIGYDAMGEERGLAALRELTGAGFIGKTAHAGDGCVPIFIVGMPRTGTTLLDRILGNHAGVVSAGELNLFSRSLSWVSDHFYDVPADESSIGKVMGAEFVEAGGLYQERIATRFAGNTHVIDKNPANVFNAGFIAKALPNARIVCMLRNPMDACFSNLKELFSGGAYAYSYDQEEVAAHYARFRRMVEHWSTALPDRFHVVEYEALVANPFQVSEEAARFCGIEFDPFSVDITRNLAPVPTASSSQVRQPLNAQGVGAWKRYADFLRPMRAKLRELNVLSDDD